MDKKIRIGMYQTGSGRLGTDGISHFNYFYIDSLLRTKNVNFYIFCSFYDFLSVKNFYQKLFDEFPNSIFWGSKHLYSDNPFLLFFYCLNELTKIITGQVTNWKMYPNFFRDQASLAKSKPSFLISILFYILKFAAFSARAASKILTKLNIKFNFKDTDLNQIVENCKLDVLFIPEIHSESPINIKCKKIVALHDLFTIDFEEQFKNNIAEISKLNNKIKDYCKKLSKEGAKFICLSKTVKKSLAKYIPEEEIEPVLLPVRTSDFESEPSKDILNKIGIKGDFIFYASQVRPYKNFEIILKALSLLNKQGKKIYFVTTGNLSDYHTLLPLVKKYDISKQVIETGKLSNYELQSLYKLASMCVVPTLAEGGFPWQGLESMASGTPVIMSDIEVVKERLKFSKVPEESWKELGLFDPSDAQALIERIIYTLENRNEIILKQKNIFETLNVYNRNDFAEHHYKVIMDLVKINSQN